MNVCVICDSPLNGRECIIENIPVYQGCVDTPIEDDIIQDMHWKECDVCSTIQIINLPREEDVYLKGHAAGIGKVWEDHNEQFIRFIEKNKPVRISEIGGGSGDLARMSSIEWRMYEPHPPNEISTYRDIDFIRDFYSHDNARESIVFSHVLEHLRFPKQMISDIYSSDTRKIFLAWPQLDKWVEDGIPGAINYEHFFYCTYETLIEFFSTNGFKLQDKEDFENHSHFLCFTKSEKTSELFSQDKNNFIKVENFFRKIREIKIEKPSYFMPASIYSQYYILQNPELCLGVLDNSSDKHGKRLYGTNAIVQPPTNIDLKNNNVVVSGPHKKEILDGLKRLQEHS